MRDTLGRSYWPDADTAAARMYPDFSRARSDWAFAQLRRQARLEPVPAPFHGARVIELDSGHSPFFTQPDELADLLGSLA